MSCRVGKMKNSATARERELYRYYQPEATSEASGNVNKVAPRSSNDPILTAFAQLAALRLKVKRGVITLATSCTEYIIAESGPSLSLQQDDDEDDRLWHGVGACSFGAGPELASWFCKTGSQYRVIPDLTLDDELKNKPIVTEEPFIRFLACVPLRTPDSEVVIGTFMVADNKPRHGLDEDELRFMLDMGITVMDYLESGLVKRKQHRAERMVKAMGLFIEGKSSLRDWWLEFGHRTQQAQVQKRVREALPLMERADVEFGVQDPTDSFSKTGLQGLPDHFDRSFLTRSPSSSALSAAERSNEQATLPQGPFNQSASDTTAPPHSISLAWNERHSSVTTVDTPVDLSPDLPQRQFVSFDLPPDQTLPSDLSTELQDAVVSSDLRTVFARASNLIREAVGVEGVIYFDASVGSFGGSSSKHVMDEKAPGTFKAENGMLSSDEDYGRRMSIASLGISDQAACSAPESEKSEPEKCCNILGFSTRKRSSLRGHPTSEEHRQFPEATLRRLLKRYPHGKVYNFDEDGQVSSDSDPTSSGVDTPADAASKIPTSIELKARRKRQSKEAEAKSILKVLPGARSVFWFPLWDANRDRWFAGSLIWSTSPTRALCPIEDLTYLAAFGNSTMAEVSRISAQVLAQMKTDFISSISHELRSPLHGVLASVEFLQDTDLNEIQSDMVGNIHASGKVLLDTINHVLDFSKVNRRSKDTGRISKRNAKRTKKRQNQGIVETPADDNADICLLSEEVIESIYAGHRISKHAFGSSTDRHLSIASGQLPVTIIVDIVQRQNWLYDIDAGAWRRILMNLFSNAMKYTKTGFIRISLDIEDDESFRNKNRRCNLKLRIKDSGKGISQEFLNHQLFKPFKQEDSLASGAGLGLSIVRHVIQDLGGHIDFTSEQGTGTEVTVQIPLAAAGPYSVKTTELDIIAEVRTATKGLRFSLEGFERYPDISEPPTGILSSESEAAMLLKSTTINVLKSWFEMQPIRTSSNLETAPAEVVVVMEAGLSGKTLEETLAPYNKLQIPGGKKGVAVVLCNTYHPGTKSEICKNFLIVHVQQPYGPHKLAKMLHKAFCQGSSALEELGGLDKLQLPSSIIRAETNAPSPNKIDSPGSTAESFAQPRLEPRNQRSRIQLTKESSVGGEINQASNPERLTADTPLAQTSETPTSAPANPESEGLRVLLVEDNEINLKLLVAYMRKLKLLHTTATNGLEALEAYKDCLGNFDVIFMDISMPVMSGIESTQHIRRFEREKGLRPCALIALTGAANPNTRQEAFSSGIDLFLTKPVPMKALKVMLDNFKSNGRDGLSVPEVG